MLALVISSAHCQLCDNSSPCQLAVVHRSKAKDMYTRLVERLTTTVDLPDYQITTRMLAADAHYGLYASVRPIEFHRVFCSQLLDVVSRWVNQNAKGRLCIDTSPHKLDFCCGVDLGVYPQWPHAVDFSARFVVCVEYGSFEIADRRVNAILGTDKLRSALAIYIDTESRRAVTRAYGYTRYFTETQLYGNFSEAELVDVMSSADVGGAIAVEKETEFAYHDLTYEISSVGGTGKQRRPLQLDISTLLANTYRIVYPSTS